MPYTPVHPLISLFLCLLWFVARGQPPDWTLITISFVGALLPDLDHLAVLAHGNSPFVIQGRKLIRSGRPIQAMKLFMSRERKDIGPMYLHNFVIFFPVAAIALAALVTDNPPLVFLVTLGVFPHMCVDVVDDLLVLGSFRNWRRFPKTDLTPSQVTPEEMAETLQHALQNLSTVLKTYSYILSSCSSLPQSIVWTLTVKWHVGRRIESYVRVYRPVLAISELRVLEAASQEIDHMSTHPGQKKQTLGDTLREFDALLGRLPELAKLIRSPALSYISSSILVVLGLVVGFLVSNASLLAWVVNSPWLSTLLSGLLIVAVLGLAVWDLNLWRYVRTTTARVGKKTLMQLEHELYRDALLVLGFRPKRSGIFSVGIAAIEIVILPLLAILLVGSAGILVLIVLPMNDSIIRFLCIAVLVLTAMIPAIFGPYVVELARSLRLAQQHEIMEHPSVDPHIS